MNAFQVIPHSAQAFVPLIHLFKSVWTAMCHISRHTEEKELEKTFDMYENKSAGSSRGGVGWGGGMWTHRPGPLILRAALWHFYFGRPVLGVCANSMCVCSHKSDGFCSEDFLFTTNTDTSLQEERERNSGTISQPECGLNLHSGPEVTDNAGFCRSKKFSPPYPSLLYFSENNNYGA